jgi:hypothetical protein
LASASAAATGAATASTAAAGAATVSSSAPEVPTPIPDVPSPSAQPAAEEELEEVCGRRLLLGPPEEEADPLPQVLVRIRQSIEEATSTTEAAFRREWAALESERQRLGNWHTRLVARTKAEASHSAHSQSKLKADQEAYRANLRKVFDRVVAVAGREKALALREEAFCKEVATLTVQRSELETRLAAQWSELETRSQGLEIRKQELDKLSGSLHQWCQELQEAASKQTAAEMELEEDRKSLARRESLTTNMEL